jgi:phosphoglycolate phosphatase-like HAD superfamily hydrolase
VKTLLLFDLDGTLLLTHGAGVRCMERAGQQIWGPSFSLEGISFGGGLDPLILAEALQKLGQELDDALHERFQRAYEAELRGELSANPTVQVLPGIAPLLERVRRHERSILGLLTGNYAPTGIAKLEAAQIQPDWFSVKIWGDDGPTRPDLVRVAMTRSGNIPPSQVVVIGDTPRDVDCAAQNGCRSIAVATGGYSREELQAAGADIVFDDLSDSAALWAFVHG